MNTSPIESSSSSEVQEIQGRRALGDIEHQIIEMSKRITQLNERLEFVLSPSLPTACPEDKGKEGAESSCSGFTDALRGFVVRLKQMNAELNSIRMRIDV